MKLSLTGRLKRLGGGFDRLNDLVIARATTEVAGHPLFDLLLGGSRCLSEQGVRGEHLARRADAALKATLLDEGFLNGVEVFAVGEALDGQDRSTVVLDRERQASAEHLTIDNDGAGAAHADRAAFF